jgi:Uma2 family endonuclease
MPLTQSFYPTPSKDFNSLPNSLISDQFQLCQSRLLESTFTPPDYPADRVFSGSNINLYFDPRHPQQFKRPDWFGVLGVDKLYQRQNIRTSYVAWQESYNPFIVVEFLSSDTATEDLGQTPVGVDAIPTKWDVYERFLRIPYYILFDPETNQLEGFQIIGSHYEELEVKNQRLWIPELELGLGLCPDIYEGLERQWLRWYDVKGNLLELQKNQRQTGQPNPELIQKREQIDQQQKLGQKLTDRLKKFGLKVDSI